MDKPIQLKEGQVHQEIHDDTLSPEKKYIFSESKNIIQNTIESLPEKYRSVILLRHNEERSYEEISEILNIPIGTVKARIFRAREMLKIKLKEK